MEQFGSQWRDFYEILYLGIFRKSVEENSSFIKIRQDQPVLYMKTCVQSWSYLSEYFQDWEILHIQAVGKIKHILFAITFSPLPLSLSLSLFNHAFNEMEGK